MQTRGVDARERVRFTLGAETTEHDVADAAAAVARAVSVVRAIVKP